MSFGTKYGTTKLVHYCFLVNTLDIVVLQPPEPLKYDVNEGKYYLFLFNLLMFVVEDLHLLLLEAS
jgi:hypothetical protein